MLQDKTTADIPEITAFRLELDTEKGKWTSKNTPVNIDGEVYDGTRIQAVLMPNSVKLIA